MTVKLNDDIAGKVKILKFIKKKQSKDIVVEAIEAFYSNTLTEIEKSKKKTEVDDVELTKEELQIIDEIEKEQKND